MPKAGAIIRTRDVPHVIAMQAITANSADVTAESVAITLPAVTFENGRAYRFELETLMAVSAIGSAAGNPRARARVRKTNVAGSLYVDWHAVAVSNVNGANYMVSARRVLTCSADTVQDIALTILCDQSSGSSTVRLAGSATSAAGHFAVYDIGIAADWPGVNFIS